MNWHYSATGEVNDACNCHPEYHEIDLEAETLSELAVKIAGQMSSYYRLRLEHLTIVKHRHEEEPLTAEELTTLENQVTPALKQAKDRLNWTVTVNQVKLRLQRLEADLSLRIQGLERDRPNLNIDAIHRRTLGIQDAETAVAQAKEELEACLKMEPVAI